MKTKPLDRTGSGGHYSSKGRNGGNPRDAQPYEPPNSPVIMSVADLLGGIRSISADQQPRLGFDDTQRGHRLWCAGDVALVKKHCVAVVGTRNVSSDGAARARRLAKELAEAGIVVVSGLAKGIDTEALTAMLGKMSATYDAAVVATDSAADKRDAVIAIGSPSPRCKSLLPFRVAHKV